VLLPPPKCVLKPKTETSSFLALYSSASLPRSSSLETFARLGWRTSLHYSRQTETLHDNISAMSCTYTTI